MYPFGGKLGSTVNVENCPGIIIFYHTCAHTVTYLYARGGVSMGKLAFLWVLRYESFRFIFHLVAHGYDYSIK